VESRPYRLGRGLGGKSLVVAADTRSHRRVDELLGQALGLGPANIGSQVQTLQDADQACARIDLPFEDAVTCAGRIDVVQVVPGLTEGGNSQPVHIARQVAAFERALAEHVADRVDGPGHVVHESDTDNATPEHAGEESDPGPGDQAADDARKQERHYDDARECIVDALQVFVVADIGRVLIDRGLLLREQPTHVREDQAFGDGLARGAKAPRGMRIADLVGELVVLAVVGNPLVDGTFEGVRAHEGERDLHRAIGLEGAVGEVPVVSHRHTDGGERPEAEEQAQIDP